MKYKEWLLEWLEIYEKPTVKNRTYARYNDIVMKHLVPSLGDYEMDRLTPLEIQRYIVGLMHSGNLKTGKGLSANSINGILNVLRSSLSTAYLLGLIQELPVDKIKRPQSSEKPVECFSPSEQKTIERAVLRDKRTKMMGVILCLYTGLRIGELLALEWSDIDFAKSELSVTKTCYDGKDTNGRICRITDTPKTQTSIRVIPIPKQLIPLLKETKKRTESKCVVANGDRAISVRSYQRSFELLQKKCGIPHHGFHALRHTFATRAIECGMDVKTLSEILGHKNPTITLNRYVHSLMAHKKEYMNKIGKLL